MVENERKPRITVENAHSSFRLWVFQQKNLWKLKLVNSFLSLSWTIFYGWFRFLYRVYVSLCVCAIYRTDFLPNGHFLGACTTIILDALFVQKVLGPLEPQKSSIHNMSLLYVDVIETLSFSNSRSKVMYLGRVLNGGSSDTSPGKVLTVQAITTRVAYVLSHMHNIRGGHVVIKELCL